MDNAYWCSGWEIMIVDNKEKLPCQYGSKYSLFGKHQSLLAEVKRERRSIGEISAADICNAEILLSSALANGCSIIDKAGIFGSPGSEIPLYEFRVLLVELQARHRLDAVHEHVGDTDLHLDKAIDV